MAIKHDRSIPDLSNATPGFLIDEIGRMRIESARLKYLDGIYKAALDARATPEEQKGVKFIEGEEFIGDYEEVTQERIDTQAVKDYFVNNPEILARLMKVITFKKLNTKPRG